jgi:hypothetical protein
MQAVKLRNKEKYNLKICFVLPMSVTIRTEIFFAMSAPQITETKILLHNQ